MELNRKKKSLKDEEAKLAEEKLERQRKEAEEKLISKLEKKHTLTQQMLQKQIEEEKAEKELYMRQSKKSSKDTEQAQIKLIERINKEVDHKIRKKEEAGGLFGIFGSFFGLCAGSRDEDVDDDDDLIRHGN